MLTVTFSALNCSGIEEEIRNVLRELGGKDVEVEVEVEVSADGGEDQVVVRGFNGSVDEIAGTLYDRLVFLARWRTMRTRDDDDESEDEDEDDESEDDDDTYLQILAELK